MQNIFETLIGSYLNDTVGIADHFLSQPLALALKKNLLALMSEDALSSAGTGNEAKIHHDKTVRSDKIYWLDKSHNDPYENEFFKLIENFINYLNETCYTGIKEYEFHYALYEKGSFYTRHMDRFKNDDSRQFSMITYLNPDWIEGDGGELCIHHNTGELQHISPKNGKGVFFKSNELEHEVLLTHVPRMSITGWLKI